MLAHRGPDGCGVHTDGPLALGHRRLSIIDLAGGHQPMANEDGSLWITFNGEIYNYIELRAGLEARGHRFRTQSDTEVLLHLYEERGEQCLEPLNGQWAFAMWDSRRRELFLSRDRLGVRPLYYTEAGGAFLFASEIKALFAHPDVPRRLDIEGLDELFTYWSPLAPRTVFEGIRQLPPGHSIMVRGGTAATRRYWRLDYNPQPDGARPESEYAGELIERLEDAVRLRLRSDVPVGAYLSGGLDSTLVTALIARQNGARLKTFSISFREPEFDESRYQEEAARYLGTEHRVLRCPEEEIARVFPDVIWHTETPVLRTAPAPLYLLSGFVRENGYKVVLTGEGADELFGGYDIFKETKVRRFWARRPESSLRPLLLRRLYPYLPNLQATPPAFLKAFFQLRSPESPFFSHLPRWEMTSRMKLFFSDEVQAELRGRRLPEPPLPEEYGRWPWFCQAQYLESALLFPGYILSSQGDRVGLAHAVEARYPFLDPAVVDFAAALPPRLKMKVLEEKYLLKRAAAGLVPDAVRARAKQPYRAPEAASFFRGRPREYVRELLSDESVARNGVFRPAAVKRLAAKVKDGAAIGIKDNMALLGILSTQLVVEQFLHKVARCS